MKKVLLLVLAAAAGVYIYWPYRTAVKLEDAFRAADKLALDRLIDFPAVRQSLKEQVKAKMNAEAAAELSPEGNTAPTQTKLFPAVLAGTVADKVIDAMVTPDSIARFLKFEAAIGSGTSMTLHQKTWHTPTEFSARSMDNSRFVFRFTAIDGWRVVSVEPGEKLGRHAQIPR